MLAIIAANAQCALRCSRLLKVIKIQLHVWHFKKNEKYYFQSMCAYSIRYLLGLACDLTIHQECLNM